MGIYLQPIDRGWTLANKRTVVKNRFSPGKLFMQTDPCYTKLNILNGDISDSRNGMSDYVS